MHAGAALRAGAALGHAIAQALGSRYGLPHETMNAVSLPAALRFNSIAVAGELARFGAGIGGGDPVARVRIRPVRRLPAGRLVWPVWGQGPRRVGQGGA
jgi:alcohol dehydrogenase class IV